MAPLKPGFAVLPQHVEEIEMGIREAISNSRAPFGRTTQQRRPIEKRRHDTEARPLKQSSGLAKRRRMSCERGATKEAEERCAAATFIAQSITDVSDTAGEESFRTAEPEQNPKPEDNSEPVVIGSDGLPHTAPTTNPAVCSNLEQSASVGDTPSTQNGSSREVNQVVKNRLPYELIEAIGRYTDVKSQAALATCSRYYNAIVTPILWHTIPSHEVRVISRAYHTLIRRPDMREYVKQVDITAKIAPGPVPIALRDNESREIRKYLGEKYCPEIGEHLLTRATAPDRLESQIALLLALAPRTESVRTRMGTATERHDITQLYKLDISCPNLGPRLPLDKITSFEFNGNPQFDITSLPNLTHLSLLNFHAYQRTLHPKIRSLVLRNFTLRPSGGLSPVLFEALLRGMPELTDLSLEGRVMIQNKQCPEEFAILSTCEIIGAIRAGAPNVLRFHFEKSPLPGALQHSSISKN